MLLASLRSGIFQIEIKEENSAPRIILLQKADRESRSRKARDFDTKLRSAHLASPRSAIFIEIEDDN
jgi:hypothetical protein